MHRHFFFALIEFQSIFTQILTNKFEKVINGECIDQSINVKFVTQFNLIYFVSEIIHFGNFANQIVCKMSIYFDLKLSVHTLH